MILLHFYSVPDFFYSYDAQQFDGQRSFFLTHQWRKALERSCAASNISVFALFNLSCAVFVLGRAILDFGPLASVPGNLLDSVVVVSHRPEPKSWNLQSFVICCIAPKRTVASDKRFDPFLRRLGF